MTPASTAPTEYPRRNIVSWCLYDWANSAFAAIILSFVFAPYFLEHVAIDPVRGQAQWGFAISASAIAIAVLSPVFGAFADRSGRRRMWLGSCSFVSIVATAAMWWVMPEPGFVLLALVLLVIANAAFELGYVFYNAMLSVVAPPEATGRISGFGWGAGYFGSLASLGLVYALLVAPDSPLFGLDSTLAEPLRAAAPLTALWWLVFAAPLVLFGPRERPSREATRQIVTNGLGDLWRTLRGLPRMPSVLWFLVAHMFFIDGVNTLFIFGPLVAKGVFGFSVDEMLLLGVTIYLTAGVGAVGCGWLDDKFGGKRVIVVSIIALATISVSIVFLETKTQFWIAASFLGIFFGPVQASSRSLMTRISPPEMRTKLFGLYALAGRAIGPIGSALVGVVTLATGSQRAGIAVVAVTLLVGLVLLIPVREHAAKPT
ncbi:MAG: MFS transporter [Hyphomicrobiales bacterium]|nr:MFS transporter [Hyphomicrobiales bacterium]